MRAHLVALALATLALVALSRPTLAAWPGDPEVNVTICQADGEKYDVFTVSDGQGGAIIAWEDRRSGEYDIYVQRLGADGEVLWAVDGVPVCTAAGNQGIYHSTTGTTGYTPLVADGEGGAWVVWQDERLFGLRLRDIYAQRIDADGRPLLALDGVPVATGAGNEDFPNACSDGQGGVIIVWNDRNADPVFSDLWGQRLDADGRPLWNGGQPRPLITVGWDQYGTSLAPDGQGGAYLAWSDGRDDVGDIFAQRLGPDGDPLWTPTGVAVSTGSGQQDAVTARVTADAALLLAWVDRRSGSSDIYAQKLSAAGSALWTFGGVGVCTATNSQYRPAMCPDAAGGAIVAWFDYRNAPSGPPWNLDIYAQRLDQDGVPAWAPDGVGVCNAPDAQRNVDLVADGQGGAVLAWEDNREGQSEEDVYAQHLGGDGQPSWAADGVAVSTAPNNQQHPDLVLGGGGAIVAWTDDRDVLYDADIYADHVVLLDPTAAPLPLPGDVSLRTWGDPAAGATMVAFALPRSVHTTLDVVDLRGRLVARLASGTRGAGDHRLAWDHRDASGRSLPSGVYLLRLRAGGQAAAARVTIVR